MKLGNIISIAGLVSFVLIAVSNRLLVKRRGNAKPCAEAESAPIAEEYEAETGDSEPETTNENTDERTEQ